MFSIPFLFAPDFTKDSLFTQWSRKALWHLATPSGKLLKVPLNMGADKTLAGPVEDLLEALVAGHLHAKLHHLVDLLRLVSVLALFLPKFLAPHLHHLGGTGPNGLLSDGLGHTGWKGHHVGSKGFLVELSFIIDPSHHVENAEIALHLLLNGGLNILDGGTVLALAFALALALALLALLLALIALALAPPPV